MARQQMKQSDLGNLRLIQTSLKILVPIHLGKIMLNIMCKEIVPFVFKMETETNKQSYLHF